MSGTVYPKSLEKGDKIAIISPAGSVTPEQLKSGLDLIKSNGYEPVLGKNIYQNFSDGYSYAGTEAQRIHDLNWAFSDDEISAVWASRGGYGCQHLLRHVRLSNFRKTPKWYIGYSDNTVIQSYLLKHNFASIHGQTVKTSSFGVTYDSCSEIFKILKGASPKYLVEANPFNRNGMAVGTLVGGNLALIYALLATPYSFKFKGNILFIEDIGENFYALDRMIMALELSGVFRKIAGLVVGGMTNMGDEKSNKNYGESFDELAYRLISERIKKYRFPAMFGFPNGHIKKNLPLIIGANVKMEVDGGSLLIFSRNGNFQ